MKFGGNTVAAIVVFEGGKILFIKRKTPVFKGYWALPGGRMKEGETAEEAVVREIKEETGLTVKVVEKIGEYDERGVQDGIEYDYHSTCFYVRPVEGEIKPQKEVETIELFHPKALPKELAFRHSDMIEDYFKRKTKTIKPINREA